MSKPWTKEEANTVWAMYRDCCDFKEISLGLGTRTVDEVEELVISINFSGLKDSTNYLDNFLKDNNLEAGEVFCISPKGSNIRREHAMVTPSGVVLHKVGYDKIAVMSDIMELDLLHGKYKVGKANYGSVVGAGWLDTWEKMLTKGVKVNEKSDTSRRHGMMRVYDLEWERCNELDRLVKARDVNGLKAFYLKNYKCTLSDADVAGIIQDRRG